MSTTIKWAATRPMNITTYSLQSHKENKRVWLQTRYLELMGLAKNTLIDIIFDKEAQTITIYKDIDGKRKISGRANGLPVVDIKNKQVSETLGNNVDKITVRFYIDRVEISVAKQERLLTERRSKTNNKAVEIFSGGGTLSKFAERAGFKMDTAIELEDKFIAVYDRNIDITTTICVDVNDIDVDDLPTDCSHLQLGYPCTKYSNSNIVLTKKNKENEVKVCQERREADYLCLSILEIIKRVNPRSILIEEVPEFAKSVPFDILSYALEQMKYKISMQDITGSFTNRKRIAIVAIADDSEEVDLSDIQYQKSRPIEEHLDLGINEREFQPIQLRPRESGALRKGLGIRSHLPDELKINTITTHWTRHTHVSLKHPSKQDHFSDFTVNEVRKLHGLPDGFELGDTVTTARAVLGQGVTDGFLDVLKRIHKRICGSTKVTDINSNILKTIPEELNGKLALSGIHEKIENTIYQLKEGNLIGAEQSQLMLTF
jgi:site-specific DNA-cytosine methylase